MRLPRLAAASLVAVASLASGWAPVARAASEIETLVEQMGGPDVGKRYPAYQALSARKDPAMIAPLLDRIASWDLNSQAWGTSALQALAPAEAAPAWKKLLACSSPFVRLVAALQTRDADPGRASKVVVEAMAAASKDPNALMTMLPRLSSFKDAEVLKSVRAFVRGDADPGVLYAALDCLNYAQDKEAPPLARDLARNPACPVRFLAIAWLIRLGDEEFAPAFADAMKAGEVTYSDFNRMRWWLETAEHVPDAVLDAVAAQAEVEVNSSYVVSLCYLLGKRRHTAAAPMLKRLIESPDNAVSKAAFEALVQIPGSFGGDALRRQLSSPDPSRRLIVAEALRRADDLSGLPEVLDLAKAGSPVRSEAVRILGGFRVDASVEPLIDALLDEDATTRSWAQSSLAPVFQTLFPYRRIDIASTGYGTATDAAARAAAVARIRAWWTANKGKSW